MSRSGYIDDLDDQWRHIMWRGAVASAIRGRRGQAFLREMLRALDDLPDQRLIAHNLEKDDAVCAIGAVGKARGLDMDGIDSEESEKVASLFNISEALTREIVFMNDEAAFYNETAEQRFQRMRKWVQDQIRIKE